MLLGPHDFPCNDDFLQRLMVDVRLCSLCSNCVVSRAVLSQAAVQKHLWCFVVAFESPVELPLKRCGTWFRNNCTSVFENHDDDIYRCFPFFLSYISYNLDEKFAC